ncbi:MAG: hypothetical protein HY608_11865 [Planctomycetes bacterium]|nr:hypothetical protein [Planctomycetota bacterium]
MLKCGFLLGVALLLAVPLAFPVELGRVAPLTEHLLDFEFLDRPREVLLEDPLGAPRAAWAIPYRLRNPGHSPREVTLEFFVETDVQDLDGRLVRLVAGDDRAARQEIEKRARREYLDHSGARGLLRAGQVKECVAVFSRIPEEADFMDLHVIGLTPVERRERGPQVRAGDRTIAHPLKQTAGAYYRGLLQVGVDVRRHERGVRGRHGFLPVVTEIDSLTYERLHNEELSVAQALLQEDPAGGAARIRESDLLAVSHERPDARRAATYYRMTDPMLNADQGIFRETWVRVSRFVRRGDQFYVDADVTSLAETSWLLAVEPVEDPR